MRSLHVERLVLLATGFIVGVVVGALGVAVYVMIGGGVLQTGPDSFAFINVMELEEPPPPNRWWSADSYGDHAIHVPLNRILLVRSGDALGAIQFTGIDTNNGKARGRTWLLAKSDDGTKLIVGEEDRFEVWELYDVVGTQVVDGVPGTEVVDAGGQLTIPVGAFDIEWSASSWLYFKAGLEFALLDAVDIEDVTIETLKAITVPATRE